MPQPGEDVAAGLEAERIGRRASPTQWIVRDVSLSVRPGDRIGLVGPSGSGKSVFLRALALLDPLDEGELRFRGRVVFGRAVPRYRSRVMYAPQRAPLFDGSVLRNLELPFRLKIRRGSTFDRARAVRLLESLGRSEDFLAQDAQDLSGGEAQIVALTRVLQLDPSVLLLDEPTAALDRDSATLVERVMSAWVHERPDERAFVWVGHDLEQVARVVRRTIRMERGRLSEVP